VFLQNLKVVWPISDTRLLVMMNFLSELYKLYGRAIFIIGLCFHCSFCTQDTCMMFWRP